MSMREVRFRKFPYWESQKCAQLPEIYLFCALSLNNILVYDLFSVYLWISVKWERFEQTQYQITILIDYMCWRKSMGEGKISLLSIRQTRQTPIDMWMYENVAKKSRLNSLERNYLLIFNLWNVKEQDVSHVDTQAHSNNLLSLNMR